MRSACDLRKARSTEKLVQPLDFLRRPRGHFELFNDKGEQVFVSSNEKMLYAPKASTTRNRKDSFSSVQGIPFNVFAALHAFSKDFPKSIHNAILPLELYNIAAKNEHEWSVRLDRRLTGLPTRLVLCKVQKRGSFATHFGVTATAMDGC